MRDTNWTPGFTLPDTQHLALQTHEFNPTFTFANYRSRWKGPYFEEEDPNDVFLDAWGNKIRVWSNWGKSYFWSAGADEEFDEGGVSAIFNPILGLSIDDYLGDDVIMLLTIKPEKFIPP